MKIDILAGWKECAECDSKFAGVWAVGSGVMVKPLCFDCFNKYLRSITEEEHDNMMGYIEDIE